MNINENAKLLLLRNLREVSFGKSFGINWQNKSLTRKFLMSLNDKFCVASDSLPLTIRSLLHAGYDQGAFLFPFELRRYYFLATAFGVRRALYFVQREDNSNVGLSGGIRGPSSRGSPSPSRSSSSGMEGRFRLSKLKKELVTMSREHIVSHATLFFAQHASRKAALEIRFLSEKGTGSGVTREFYSVLAFALQSRQGSNCSALMDKESLLSLVPCELTVSSGYMDVTHSGNISTQYSGFPTMIANQNIALRSGKWYYEVEITKNGLAQIGFASSVYDGGDSEKGDGVGDDQHSWAYDGARVLKWHGGTNEAYGKGWKVGDVVGCCLDMVNRQIQYSLNGSFSPPMGVAFSSISADVKFMYPALTINTSFGGKVCFGGGMHGATKYDPPEGYKCLFQAYDLPILNQTVEAHSKMKGLGTKSFDIWVDDLNQEGEYIMNPIGLFPSPLPKGHEATDVVCKRFQLIGRLVGRALLDEQILPLPLSHEFLSLVMGNSVPVERLPSIFVDSPTRGKLIQDLLHTHEGERNGTSDSRKTKLKRQLSAELYMEDMVTGAPLVENGNDILVDEDNYMQYVSLMHKFLCNDGTKKQVDAFKQGLNDVGGNVLTKLKMFSPQEIRQMICGNETIQWTEDEIFECINAEHGYQKDSKEIRDLASVLCEFDQKERKSFLTFLTGCPHLPAGGLKNLMPPICIYKKKPSDEAGHIDNALTSSRTCRNQLHLPPYSNVAIMRQKIKQSMEESLGVIDLA